MSDELKPCPMCEGPARHVKHSAGISGTMGYDAWHGVACSGCGANVGASDRRFRYRSDAAAAWNRRPSTAPSSVMVPLSDEQITNAWRKVVTMDGDRLENFTRLVESAHGVVGTPSPGDSGKGGET